MTSVEQCEELSNFSMENNPDHTREILTTLTDCNTSNPDGNTAHVEAIGSETANTGDSQHIQNTSVESACLVNPLPSPPPPSSSESAVKQMSSSANREALYASAQEVIEEINAKRKQDTQILADFKKAMELQVSKTCTLVEQQMFRTYENMGKDIQSKLQELYSTLDRIAQLETELQQFSEALQILYSEMHHGD